MEKGEREGVGETDIEGETGTELGNSVEGEGKGKKETERESSQGTAGDSAVLGRPVVK